MSRTRLLWWVVLCMWACSLAGAQTVLYVAANGSDAGTGSVGKPFATLARARDEIRALRGSGRLSKDGAMVVVRGGTYYLAAPLELTAQDSGSEKARIVYTAYPGEEVRISGGRAVGNFTRVIESGFTKRISDSKALPISVRRMAAGWKCSTRTRPFGWHAGPTKGSSRSAS
jgi:hypothetical protein